jgi:hypothetical protein
MVGTITPQAGKLYITRDGSDAVVDAVNRGGKYGNHGAVLLLDGTWRPVQWSDQGYCLAGGALGAYDIISEAAANVLEGM